MVLQRAFPESPVRARVRPSCIAHKFFFGFFSRPFYPSDPLDSLIPMRESIALLFFPLVGGGCRVGLLLLSKLLPPAAELLPRYGHRFKYFRRHESVIHIFFPNGFYPARRSCQGSRTLNKVTTSSFLLTYSQRLSITHFASYLAEGR